MIDTTVSHYKILGKLGEGGMGEVYLAEDIRLHRPVALKLLRRGTCCGEEERISLLREARAASALNHPNIAVIYDVEETSTAEGPAWLLAMEYVPGKTLSQLAGEEELGLDAILDLVCQAASALSEAHRRGVVHRDVKPSNLMVAQGRLKVLDFGLALQRPNAPDALTWSRDPAAGGGRDWAGTPFYMAPEQALGRPVDARSDIFSLGVVLYELLAGARPFTGESTVELLDSILHREPPPLPPRFADPRLPEIGRLLERMLAKEPAARVGEMSEVCAEITRLQAAAVPPAAPGTLSVAVAGFTNITRRGEDEWIATGLTETVTAALREVEGLEILGRERVSEQLQRLGATAGDGGELGGERAVRLGRLLGSRWVLSGGVQRLGDQVRATAQLVEVGNGKVARAVRADGRADSIFALQDRVVAELVSDLKTSVAALHQGDETRVVAAYEALSTGLLNMRADTYESLERAILFFERALALDPEYIRAQLELSTALAQKAEHLVSPELQERAISVLRRVLDRQPRLPRAWRELGATLVAMGRFEEGEQALERALALASDEPTVLGAMGRALFLGRGDFAGAADYLERATLKNPGAGWYYLQLAHVTALLRHLERGERAARRAIALQEASLSGQQGVHIVGSYMRLGHVLALSGRYAEAKDAFTSELAWLEHADHALRSRILIELHLRLGAAHLALGETTRGSQALEAALESFDRRVALGADEPFTRYYAAATHALRGERDEALRLLEQSVAARPAFMRARARIEPEWEGLREDAAFRSLVGAG